MSNADVEIQAVLSDEVIAAEVEYWLAEHNASDVDRKHQEESGFLPVVAIVVACTIASAALAELVLHIREKFQCQQIINAQGTKVEISTQCDHRNGKIIVLAAEGVVLSITDPGNLLDITDVAKTAASAGAEVAKAIVERGGGMATVESRFD
jgi:hypothetical protein